MNQLNSLSVNISAKEAFKYDIVIGENLLSCANELVKKSCSAQKFLIVTNEKVASLYQNSLNIENSIWLVLKDGEEYKNFETLRKIIDTAVENKLERNDCIIAFGGGVVGDMAGFAAATYMRGVNFVQIPTTLLAQVDSSVGGKVAINHEQGKNLIGAFYQPKLVLADVNVLKTLDVRQLKTGLAEVLKYAFIEKSCNDNEIYNFFDFLNQNIDEIYKLNPDVISKLIKICCSLKSAVVNQDETEKGLRAILNLGHTFAHAIENLTHYKKYTHGEAVALGLKMAFNLSRAKNLVTQDYYEKSIKLLEKYDIVPSDLEIDKNEMYNEMFLDKKVLNGKIKFVVPSQEYCVTVMSDFVKEDILQSLDV